MNLIMKNVNVYMLSKKPVTSEDQGLPEYVQ